MNAAEQEAIVSIRKGSWSKGKAKSAIQPIADV